jgi:hypothetical protein
LSRVSSSSGVSGLFISTTLCRYFVFSLPTIQRLSSLVLDAGSVERRRRGRMSSQAPLICPRVQGPADPGKVQQLFIGRVYEEIHIGPPLFGRNLFRISLG